VLRNHLTWRVECPLHILFWESSGAAGPQSIEEVLKSLPKFSASADNMSWGSRTVPPNLIRKHPCLANAAVWEESKMDGHCRIAIVSAAYPGNDWLRSSLLEAGHQVLLMEGSSSDFDSAASVRPDLVIIALQPDNSVATEQLLKFASAGIPLIAVVGHEDQVTAEIRALAALTAVLVEPLDAVTLAAAVEIAIRQIQRIADIRRRLDEARRALADRMQIERAKGWLMEQNALSESAAYKQLQQVARSSRRSLAAVAHDILVSKDLFGAPQPTPAPIPQLLPFSCPLPAGGEFQPG
jgi:AmiR/NasT family two-component response regulator